MRTETLCGIATLLAALALAPGIAGAQEASAKKEASTGPAFTDRLSVGAGAEVTLVGLAFGVRPELLFRPFRADGIGHLRIAAGVMQGPELTFIPANLGYRAIFSPGRSARAHLGLGLEWQNFFYGGDSPRSRLAAYAETGFEFEIFDGGWIGLQYAPDFALTGFGFGFATRVTFRYDL